MPVKPGSSGRTSLENIGEKESNLRQALVALACGGMLLSPTLAQEGAREVTFGAVTYALSCAVCHGEAGHGDGEMADELAVPAADLTGIAQRNGGVFPAERVAEVIRGGSAVTTHGGQMPAWGLVFLKDPAGPADGQPATSTAVERRIAELVASLESIQAKP